MAGNTFEEFPGEELEEMYKDGDFVIYDDGNPVAWLLSTEYVDREDYR